MEVSAEEARRPVAADSLESNFVKTETLDGDNKYKCGRCRAYVAAEKGAKIHVSPNVLVVPLKRYQMGRASKITKFVEYPLELDLSPYMSPDAPQEGEDPPRVRPVRRRRAPGLDGKRPQRTLRVVVRLLDGRWWRCDDGRVEEADEATVLKQKGYLLFYERRRRCFTRAAPGIRTHAEQARVDRLEEAERERNARAWRRAGSAARARDLPRAPPRPPVAAPRRGPR